jgi:glycosyltransferase involved in cell wall biosynthesis
VRALSVVIPALNERENIAQVLASVPVERLREQGWSTEIVVVDNGSTDGTGELARDLGAFVVEEPNRGYGNAYRAGFRYATGDVIATGDADLTYPLDLLPELLETLEEHGAEFMTTNRLLRSNREAMKASHSVGNHLLSVVSRRLFRHAFRDSQSGMWIFQRSVWARLDVRSPGMAFSQEIKNEAHLRGITCHETTIEYRPRGGTVKLNAFRDGWRNLRQLVEHRARAVTQLVPVPPVPRVEVRVPVSGGVDLLASTPPDLGPGPREVLTPGDE